MLRKETTHFIGVEEGIFSRTYRGRRTPEEIKAVSTCTRSTPNLCPPACTPACVCAPSEANCSPASTSRRRPAAQASVITCAHANRRLRGLALRLYTQHTLLPAHLIQQFEARTGSHGGHRIDAAMERGNIKVWRASYLPKLSPPPLYTAPRRRPP